MILFHFLLDVTRIFLRFLSKDYCTILHFPSVLRTYILWGSCWSCLLWDMRTLCYSIVRDLRITSHKCDQCEFAMVWACNLRIHLKTHTGETLHKCKQCEFVSTIADHYKDTQKDVCFREALKNVFLGIFRVFLNWWNFGGQNSHFYS